MSTIVVMPGGFHPFHAGHAALYNSARRAFPGAEVFVAATNDTSTRPFPFPVKEKLAKLAGVEPGHFVQVKSPFRAEEITAKFNPERDVLIFVRSEKDAGSQPKPGGVKKDGSPAYLQPLEGVDRLEPFARHAYMAYLPTVEFGPGMKSATEIRTAWPHLNEKRKTALVMSLYPKTQTSPALAANVVKLLDTAMGTELNEFSSQNLVGGMTAGYQRRENQPVNEFAPDGFDGGRPKFIPWNDFIEGVKGIVGKDFEVVENVVKSTIKARFVPIDPMEFGPTMLYSYYEARAGRNKGAISTRGAIQVGRYYPNSTALGTRNFITGFNILKGHPFERHFDLTPENISKIAAIIQGNTEGAYKTQPQQELDEFAPGGNFKPPVPPKEKGNDPFGNDDRSKILQAVRQLLLAGNKVDWKVPGQMGHVVRVNDDAVTMKRWGKPYSKIHYSLMLTDDQDDEYQILMVKPGYYKVVSSDNSWNLEENQGWAATFTNEEHRGNIDADPELKQAKLYAKQHYPEFSGDEDLAYQKWVQRSIKHGLEDDQKQFKILQGIATKIQKLEARLKQAAAQKAVAESDYIEEAKGRKI